MKLTDEDFTAIGHAEDREILGYCIHPGLFAKPTDDLDDTKYCYHCGADVPVYQL